MYYVVDLVRDLFGFTKYEFMITTLSLVFMMCNFCGGMLYSIALSRGRPRKELPLKKRPSFRLFLIFWGFLLVFAIYFHTVLYGKLSTSHVVFWGFTLVSAPVLAFFGSQITYVIFMKKIEANRRAYRNWVLKKRAERAAKLTAATKAEAEAKIAAEKKKKMDAEIDAKIANARKTHKVGQL